MAGALLGGYRHGDPGAGNVKTGDAITPVQPRAATPEPVRGNQPDYSKTPSSTFGAQSDMDDPTTPTRGFRSGADTVSPSQQAREGYPTQGDLNDANRLRVKTGHAAKAGAGYPDARTIGTR